MRYLPLILLAGLLFIIAGCGQSGDETEPRAETALEIVVWPDGEQSDNIRYTLSCDPPAGEHPDPTTACAALGRLGAEAFAPVPGDVACTEIYGGPQVAEVKGTLAGAPVAARLSRTNGCEISRWEALRVVVPIPNWDPLAP